MSKISGQKGGNHIVCLAWVTVLKKLSCTNSIIKLHLIIGVSAIYWIDWMRYDNIYFQLLHSKANINSVNEHGNTPLHYACFWGYAEIAEVSWIICSYYIMGLGSGCIRNIMHMYYGSCNLAKLGNWDIYFVILVMIRPNQCVVRFRKISFNT